MTATLPRGTTDAVLRNLFPETSPYLHDPAGWVRDVLHEHLWSKQVEISESVRDERYTAAPSAHDTGKSYVASRLVAWWLSVHEPGTAFAVTTAPTTKQVEAVLWREIKKARKRGGLPGRITLEAQWYLPIGGEDELVAYGRKPQDLTNAEEAATAFQGIHARYVLVVLDEACGIPLWLWNAVDSLVTNEHSRVLAIGNPDDPSSHFEKVCRPGSGWNVIPIDGLETPNFTDEPVPAELRDLLLSPTWVAERRVRWGEKSSLFISKVRGWFPEASDDLLISPAMVRAAQERDLSGAAIGDPGSYGWDIGELGPDETVGYLNRAGMVRHVYSAQRQETMATAGAIAAELREHPDRRSVVDKIGVGSGVYSRLREQSLEVFGFGAGERALDPLRYINRRAEAWWALRQAFVDGDIDLDPEDLDLAAELQAPKWGRDSRGRVWVESKKSMRKRGVASPNRADAVMMSFVRGSALVLDDVLEPAAGGSDEGELITDILDRDW